MQINHVTKHQWTYDERQFALSLYYKSPKAYNFLRKERRFAFPCITLIQKWINELELEVGFSSSFLETFLFKTKSMTKHERECVLMWDEMSIKELKEYNSKIDIIEGCHDLGDLGRSQDYANHALVFMLRGLKYAWKQPIAYFLSHDSVKGDDLVPLIEAAISTVTKWVSN